MMTTSGMTSTSNLVLADDVFFVPCDRIEPNPFQPRSEIVPASLEDLASSIREHGVLQPALLRPHPTRAGWFQLVSGERRWRATMQIGRAQLKATVRELDDIDTARIALEENIQRESLSDFEEARGLWKLWGLYEDKGISMSKREMARRLNKSVSFVSNRLDALGYHPDVQKLLEGNRGTLTVASLINKVDDEVRRGVYIKRVEDGAGLREVKRQVESDEGEARAERDRISAAKAASRAPDSQTQSRLNAVERGQSGQMSRGVQVTSDNARLAHQEGLPALRTLETWTAHFTPDDYKQVQEFARRVIEGDLARK